MEQTPQATTTPPQEATPTQTHQALEASETPHRPVRYPASPTLYQLRKYFVYVIVGGLIMSALVAIIGALMGNTSGLIGKSVGTVITIIVHSLVALGFISITSTKQPNKGSSIVIGTLFGITVLSLIISTLSTWEVVRSGEFILRTYSMLFTAFVTSLLLFGLYQSNETDKATVVSRNTAIISSLVLFGMLLPIIYRVNELHEFYYRVLAAVSIVVGVSIVITVIFHWYYMSKHPELRTSSKASEPLSLGKLIGRCVLIFIGIWLLATLLMGLYMGISSNINRPARPVPAPAQYY